MLTLREVNVDRKRVVLRVDFNVPITAGTVGNDERIKAIIPTIEYCFARNAEVVLLSHLGRPKGQIEPELSLRPVAGHLENLLGQKVEFIENWIEHFQSESLDKTVIPGKITLVENLRFNPSEEANCKEFGTKLGSIGDVYVFEAFAAAHRAHASTCEAIKAAPISCAGPLLAREIETLSIVTQAPAKPLVAVIGGAKVSGKLEVLEQLGKIANSILVGGGIANTLLLAQGWQVGRSLVERELIPTAQQIAATAPLELPVDVMVCEELASESDATHRLLDQITENDMIVDIGPETARRFSKIIENAGTILWNGPLGVFEIDQFGEGTRIVTTSIGTSSGCSVAAILLPRSPSTVLHLSLITSLQVAEPS